MDFGADLAALYADLARTAVRGDGSAFKGFLDTPDGVAFEVAVAGSLTLRYASDVALVDGETVTIDGQAYIVSGPPQRLADGAESLAVLVEA